MAAREAFLIPPPPPPPFSPSSITVCSPALGFRSAQPFLPLSPTESVTEGRSHAPSGHPWLPASSHPA